MDYDIIRSRRKTVAINIDRSGKVTVRAPMKLSEAEIDKFVRSKSDWIAKHTSAAGERNSVRSENLSRPPESLPIFGELCPVVNTAPYGYIDGSFHLPEEHTLEELQPYLRKLYSNIAKDALSARTRLIADRMGIEISDVKINSAKTRWGSCSSARVINLSWKLITADLRLIDYVIVHELCHTKQMNHSAAFWENVASVIPDYKDCRNALKDVQKKLSEYGFE